MSAADNSESTLQQTIALLGASDREVSSAAALVLGRLRPVQEETVEALRRALKTSDRSEASYLIDALAATGRVEVLEDLVTYLEQPGSQAEQVCQIIRHFGASALPFVRARHEGVQGWRSGAYVKALAGIPSIAAAKLLFEKLPESNWEQSRAMSVCLIETLGEYPEDARRFVTEQIREGLRRPAPTDEEKATHVVTLLRLLEANPEAAELDRLFALTQPDVIPGLRRHAIQAFRKLSLTDDEVDRLRSTLHGYLDEDGVDGVIKPCLESLESHSAPNHDPDSLRALLSSRHHLVVEYALANLGRQLGPAAAEDLLAQLESRHPRIRAIAIRTLSTWDEGRSELLALLEARGSSYLAAEIAELLTSGSLEFDPAVIERMRRSYLVEFSPGGSTPTALLQFLARQDREGFNRWLREEGLATNPSLSESTRIAWLQPLLKWRLADEENRFLLAMANLRAAEGRYDLEHPRFRRCVDLAAPLSRTQGYSLSTRMAAEKSLGSSASLAIAEALGKKGPIERREAGLIARDIEEGELSAEERSRLDKLKNQPTPGDVQGS